MNPPVASRGKSILTILLVAMLGVGLACAGEKATPTSPPAATPVPTATADPAATTEPAATPVPTATDTLEAGTPAATDAATLAPTPTPTATRTPTPTATALPPVGMSDFTSTLFQFALVVVGIGGVGVLAWGILRLMKAEGVRRTRRSDTKSPLSGTDVLTAGLVRDSGGAGEQLPTPSEVESEQRSYKTLLSNPIVLIGVALAIVVVLGTIFDIISNWQAVVAIIVLVIGIGVVALVRRVPHRKRAGDGGNASQDDNKPPVRPQQGSRTIVMGEYVSWNDFKSDLEKLRGDFLTWNQLQEQMDAYLEKRASRDTAGFATRDQLNESVSALKAEMEKEMERRAALPQAFQITLARYIETDNTIKELKGKIEELERSRKEAESNYKDMVTASVKAKQELSKQKDLTTEALEKAEKFRSEGATKQRELESLGKVMQGLKDSYQAYDEKQGQVPQALEEYEETKQRLLGLSWEMKEPLLEGLANDKPLSSAEYWSVREREQALALVAERLSSLELQHHQRQKECLALIEKLREAQVDVNLELFSTMLSQANSGGLTVLKSILEDLANGLGRKSSPEVAEQLRLCWQRLGQLPAAHRIVPESLLNLCDELLRSAGPLEVAAREKVVLLVAKKFLEIY